MEIKVGDLVRIKGNDWLGKPLGIVTEVKQLIHDQSGTEYTAVSAVVGGNEFTFPDEAFELVNSVESEKK
tara:strand:- start:507 stop:716 length:210 start_codon:yes stop_codon:yes gene_type:complete